MPSIISYLGFTTTWAIPNASSIDVAAGSITNSLGVKESTLTVVLSSSYTTVSVV